MEKLYYKEYYENERKHWWFKARMHILAEVLETKIPLQPNKGIQILNTGAATGATSVMLKEYGQVLSLEYDKDCSEFLSEVLNEEVVNASLTELPMKDEQFDLICAFDVVEHIEDHNAALQEIHRTLLPGGHVYITVPAFMMMWSKHDDINHHYRRYRMPELVSLLEDNGFEVTYRSYFNFWLFLPILLARMVSNLFVKAKGSDAKTGSDFETFQDSPINTLFYHIFKSEKAFLKGKLSFPFGVSAMIIGKKKA